MRFDRLRFPGRHIRTNAWIANHRKNEADVPERESCRLALVRPLVSKRVHVRNGRYIRNASLRSIPSRKLSIMNRCLALSFDTGAYFFKIHVYNKNNFQVSADCQSYAHLLSLSYDAIFSTSRFFLLFFCHRFRGRRGRRIRANTQTLNRLTLSMFRAPAVRPRFRSAYQRALAWRR